MNASHTTTRRRVRGVRALLLGAGCCWLVMAAACRRPESRPDLLLQSVPEPATLEELDEPVREQYLERRAALDAQLQEGLSVDLPRLAESFGRLAMWHHAYGDLEAAKAGYGNATALTEHDPRWVYYLGHVHRQLGELDEARRWLERYSELAPEDRAARVWLGDLELDAGRPEQAAAHYQLALDQPLTAHRARYGLGRVALLSEDWERAVAELDRVVAGQPGASAARYALGLALRGAGEAERAEALLASAVGGSRETGLPRMADPLWEGLQRLDTGARGLAGQTHRAFAAGRTEESIAAARAGVEADPDASLTHTNLGGALLQAQRWDEAIVSLERAVELGPDNAIAHFNLGVAHVGRQDLAGAMASYRHALEIDPAFREALLELAGLERQAGDLASALARYQEVERLDPGSDTARFWQTALLAREGRFAAALTTVEGDLLELPDSPRLAWLRIRLLAAAADPAVSDPERALGLARELYDHYRVVPVAEALALAHAAAGDFAAATELQQQVLAAARSAGHPPATRRAMSRLAEYHRERLGGDLWSDETLQPVPIRVPDRDRRRQRDGGERAGSPPAPNGAAASNGG